MTPKVSSDIVSTNPENTPNDDLLPEEKKVSDIAKEILKFDEFANKYLQSYEKYYREMKALFPDHPDSSHKKNYEIYRQSLFRRYKQRMTTNNDPGTVL